MKPLAARISAYTALVPVETSTTQVYDRILWTLNEERLLLEETVWAPRISARHWRRLHTRYAELQEIIAIVRALRDRHVGAAPPPPRRLPVLNPPQSEYGET